MSPVYKIWPLTLRAFSLGIENYTVRCPESKDMIFSALSDTFVLQKKKKKKFISRVVPGTTWRPELNVARKRKDLRPICKVGMNLQGENRTKSVFQLF